MSISQARNFVSSIQDLSTEDKTHLNTLLDRGLIVPNAVLGEDAESLKGVVSRNPLIVIGIICFILTYSILFFPELDSFEQSLTKFIIFLFISPLFLIPILFYP